MCLLILYAGVALFAPFLAPHDPLQANIANRLKPPSAEYHLGTDQLGRCLYSRLLLGARNTLLSAGAVLSATLVIGTLVGLFAGFLGGRCDFIIQRALDGVMAFPGLILALAIAGLLGPGLENAVLALSLVHWAGYARIVRNMTLSWRERTFVYAAQTAGADPVAILRRHILPAIVPSIAVIATLDYGRIILSIAGLSFLGLGAQPPAPEWGSMLSDGKAYMQIASHLIIWPGAAIMGIVLALQLFGDALKRIWNEQDVERGK
ncbi:MAG: ABC transporter permease subunit [Negativicutes bacterium]|nr:ABC transporter permease subunit [Negativicutes bacterium]